MIRRIKNVWLRRSALVAFCLLVAPPLLVLVGILKVWSESSALLDSAVGTWRRSNDPT